MDIITTTKAAKLLGINERSVRKAADRGHLACTWGDTGYGVSGRIFTAEALNAYTERKRALFSPNAVPSSNAEGLVF